MGSCEEGSSYSEFDCFKIKRLDRQEIKSQGDIIEISIDNSSKNDILYTSFLFNKVDIIPLEISFPVCKALFLSVFR